MKRYTMKEIMDSLPIDKKKGDSLIALYVVRPLSYPLTYLFVNNGFLAWSVSAISVLVAVAGCFSLWFNSILMRWTGFVLIFLWSILDCVDGNVARVTKTDSPLGAFMDAESGYVMSALAYISLGMAAYNTTGLFYVEERFMFIIFGAIASISDLLARLIHQRYKVSILENQVKSICKTDRESRFVMLRKRVSAEVGIAGFVTIAVPVAELLNVYDLIISIYFIYCGISAIIIIGLYSIKARI